MSSHYNTDNTIAEAPAGEDTKKKSSKPVIIAISAVAVLLLISAAAIAFVWFSRFSPVEADTMSSAEIKQWISDSLTKEELTKEELKSVLNSATEDEFSELWKSSLFLAVGKTELDKDLLADTLESYTSLYKKIYSEAGKITDFINYSAEFEKISEKVKSVKTDLGYMPRQTVLSTGEFYVYGKITESQQCDTLKNIAAELKEFSQIQKDFFLGSEVGYDDYWQMCPTGERFVFISSGSAFPEFTDYTLTYEYTGKTASVKDTDGKTYTCKIMRIIDDPELHGSKTQLVEEINNSFYNAVAKMTTSMVKLEDGKELESLCTVYNMPFEDDGSMDLTISQANNILSLRFSGKYYSETVAFTEVMYPSNEDGSSWVTYDINTKEISTEIFFNADGSISLTTAFLSDSDTFPPLNGKYTVVPSGEPVNGYIADKPVTQPAPSTETVYVQSGSSSSSSSYSNIDPYSLFGRNYVDYYSGSFYRVEVGGSVLNVRSGPGKGYSLMTQLADQTDVAVLGTYNGWAYVQYAFYGYQGFSKNNSTYYVEGWVSADYLDIIPYSP